MLSPDELISLKNNKPPLVEQMIDPDIQVQPNDIELTLVRVEVHEGSGAIGLTIQREIPPTIRIDFNNKGWVHLPNRSYKMRRPC